MNFKEQLAAIFAEILAKIKGETPAVVAPVLTTGQFSEADIEKAKTEAKAKGKEEAAAEFAEQKKQTRLGTIKGEIAAFCESLIKAGKITPATVAFGLPEILFSLAESDNQIEFGEKKEKATTFDRMKALLESARSRHKRQRRRRCRVGRRETGKVDPGQNERDERFNLHGGLCRSAERKSRIDAGIHAGAFGRIVNQTIPAREAGRDNSHYASGGA
jgi:hypothetical protein